MKLAKRLAAMALTVALAFTLTACDMKEVAADLVYNAVKAAGFVSDSGDEDEATTDVYATQGGSVTFPEGMETSARFTTMVQDGNMFVAFNGIANRSTSYFVAAGTDITVTSYATTESTGLLEYKSALWELSDDMMTTSYVTGSTVYFTTGGECYTQGVSGLTPGKKYKITISYDSGQYYITGGLEVNGLAGDELTDIEDEKST